MPSPIAHALPAYLIYHATSEGSLRLKWRILFFYCVCTNLADLDFVPGILLGAPNQFHRGISHSLGFAIGFGLVMGFVLFLIKNQSVVRNFLIFFSLYFSHVLFDLLTSDSSSPHGVPALWPITGSYYISPVSIFLSIDRARAPLTFEAFTSSLFISDNWLPILIELLVFLPFVALMLLFRRKS